MKKPWWVVFGSIVGLMVGNGPIVFFTFGLFLGPVTREFGWDRGTFSSTLLVGHGYAAAAYPFLRRAIAEPLGRAGGEVDVALVFLSVSFLLKFLGVGFFCY